MKENKMKDICLTGWDRVDAMADDDIDTSDIPPLDESFFQEARLRIPEATTAITIQIDSEVLAWFKSKGKGYRSRINEVLRSYVEAQEA